MATKNTRFPAVWQTLGEAWQLYKDNFSLLYLISITTAILPVTQAILDLSDNIFVKAGGMAIGYGGSIVNLVAGIALICALIALYNGKKTTYAKSFGAVLNKFWPFLAASIVSGFITVVSSIPFIIPMLYFAVAYYFVGIAAVAEDTEKTDPLKLSRALVKGNFWKVVLYQLATAVTAIPIALLYGGFLFLYFRQLMDKAGAHDPADINPGILIVLEIAASLYAPFMMATAVVLYYKLKKLKKNSPDLDEKKLKPVMNGCALAAILAGVIALVYILIIVAAVSVHK